LFADCYFYQVADSLAEAGFQVGIAVGELLAEFVGGDRFLHLVEGQHAFLQRAADAVGYRFQQFHLLVEIVFVVKSRAAAGNDDVHIQLRERSQALGLSGGRRSYAGDRIGKERPIADGSQSGRVGE
jgi:hypothetical protein